jgi:C-terminal processing protease CtpA/Prc
MSGLGLYRYSNLTVVWSVRRGSPAHKADIRPNDVILEIGNKKAEKYKLWEIEQLLMSGDNHMVTLTIKRGRDVKEESFVLRKRI